MLHYNRMEMGRMAKELGFVRDTLEKVCRLADVLKFMEKDSILSQNLALKGGTAINLTIFNLPRLSVDIDMDFTKNLPKDEMTEIRNDITERIGKYMSAGGYTPGQKTKHHHALDSFVFEYVNSGGVKDNIKIEINYMLRCHVFPAERRTVILPWNEEKFTVLSAAPVEIFAAKTVALLNRTAPRDLYDMHNMVRFGLFDESEQDMFHKCVVFYSAIAAEKPPENFAFSNIGKITQMQIKRELNPVLRAGEKFYLDAAQKEVENYLREILVPQTEERLFWKCFSEGIYYPNLVFEDVDIQKRISSHPMAVWKCRDKQGKSVENVSKPVRR